MHEKIKQAQEGARDIPELIKKFDTLDESEIAHSVITGELFENKTFI